MGCPAPGRETVTLVVPGARGVSPGLNVADPSDLPGIHSAIEGSATSPIHTVGSGSATEVSTTLLPTAAVTLVPFAESRSTRMGGVTALPDSLDEGMLVSGVEDGSLFPSPAHALSASTGTSVAAAKSVARARRGAKLFVGSGVVAFMLSILSDEGCASG